MYNIEKPITSVRTQLAEYRTNDFTLQNIYFKEEADSFLETLEFDEKTNTCYVLGFMRGESGAISHGFMGKFINGTIEECKKISSREYDYISAYKHWESTGCTERSYEWSSLKKYVEKPFVSLKLAYENTIEVPEIDFERIHPKGIL